MLHYTNNNYYNHVLGMFFLSFSFSPFFFWQSQIVTKEWRAYPPYVEFQFNFCFGHK